MGHCAQSSVGQRGVRRNTRRTCTTLTAPLPSASLLPRVIHRNLDTTKQSIILLFGPAHRLSDLLLSGVQVGEASDASPLAETALQRSPRARQPGCHTLRRFPRTRSASPNLDYRRLLDASVSHAYIAANRTDPAVRTMLSSRFTISRMQGSGTHSGTPAELTLSTRCRRGPWRSCQTWTK